mgnify:CR=1 FL=1
MILPCKFRPIRKNSFSADDTAPYKMGRYLHSIFPIDGFGHSRWVVGGYVDIDHREYIKNMTPEAFVEGCINYLNQPPERKKFEKRQTTSLYGELEVYSYKLKENNDGPFVELVLITGDPKNQHFWGEGMKFDQGRKKRTSKNRSVPTRK